MWLSLFLACIAGGEKPILLSTNCDKVVDVESDLILRDSLAYLTEHVVLGIAIAGDTPWARKQMLFKNFIFSHSAKTMICLSQNGTSSLVPLPLLQCGECSKHSCELSPTGVIRKVSWLAI